MLAKYSVHSATPDGQTTVPPDQSLTAKKMDKKFCCVLRVHQSWYSPPFARLIANFTNFRPWSINLLEDQETETLTPVAPQYVQGD